jgi:hypothetical protein
MNEEEINFSVFFFSSFQNRAGTMDPIDLYEVAKGLVQRHLNHLDDEREEKTLYKRIDRYGKCYGRSFVKNGAVYRSLRFSRIRIKRLNPSQKRGEPHKYWLALREIFTLNADMSTTAFLCFLEKNEDKILHLYKNLSTTRTVLRLLFQDPLFMNALREQQEREAQTEDQATATKLVASMLCFILPPFLTLYFILYCSFHASTELYELSFHFPTARTS